jgi:hypothetical protein
VGVPQGKRRIALADDGHPERAELAAQTRAIVYGPQFAAFRGFRDGRVAPSTARPIEGGNSIGHQ